MKVKLVSVTQPTQEFLELGVKTPEDILVYCARVSNPSNQSNMDTAPNLIRYCVRMRHWSIFEQASFAVEIETSRAIAAQILRHRSFTFQEFSQRYAKAELGFETYEAREQGKTNRQGSTDTLSDEVKDWFTYAQETVQALCQIRYDQALEKGIAKEQARFLLPLSTTTRLYMSGTVRSWIHYLESRCDSHAQQEHREIAEEIKKVFIGLFPHTAEALGWMPIG